MSYIKQWPSAQYHQDCKKNMHKNQKQFLHRLLHGKDRRLTKVISKSSPDTIRDALGFISYTMRNYSFKCMYWFTLKVVLIRKLKRLKSQKEFYLYKIYIYTKYTKILNLMPTQSRAFAKHFPCQIRNIDSDLVSSGILFVVYTELPLVQMLFFYWQWIQPCNNIYILSKNAKTPKLTWVFLCSKMPKLFKTPFFTVLTYLSLFWCK